jgi:hypothetical protein
VQTHWIAKGEISRCLGGRVLKKRSRLRRRIREWLNKKKLRKEENPLPSFANHWMNRNQEKWDNAKEFFHNEKPTEK